MSQLTKEECIALLKQKYEELKSQGKSEYPKRADFSEKEVIMIKSYFGPWPRALEAAGVKPVNEALLEKKKQNKIDRKRKKAQRKIAVKKRQKEEAAADLQNADP